MSDAAFNFQTLNPDVLLDALWETGIRVESGLTALNSYENRVYQFSDDENAAMLRSFIAHSAGVPNRLLKNISTHLICWLTKCPSRRHCG